MEVMELLDLSGWSSGRIEILLMKRGEEPSAWLLSGGVLLVAAEEAAGRRLLQLAERQAIANMYILFFHIFSTF
jgi:hypothetical protein